MLSCCLDKALSSIYSVRSGLFFFCLVQGRRYSIFAIASLIYCVLVLLLCCVQTGHVIVGTTAQPHEILANLPNDCALILLFFESFMCLDDLFELIKVFLYSIQGPIVELDFVLVFNDALKDLIKILIINNYPSLISVILSSGICLLLNGKNSYFFGHLIHQYFIIHLFDSFDIIFFDRIS